MSVENDKAAEIGVEYLRDLLAKLAQKLFGVFDGLGFRVEVLLAHQVNHNQCQGLRA